MSRLQDLGLVKWAATHPRLAAWAVLSLGMLVLLFIEARDVGLLPTQWVALVVATVLVAGACIWIISWEDESDDTSGDVTPAEQVEQKDEAA
ncbi:MAG: hypothetical protein D6712_09560 [Chloroflexi bacterium]|nr:MAG: hypothetical protein D6712_09560 [Chloroflexota bacterium]